MANNKLMDLMNSIPAELGGIRISVRFRTEVQVRQVPESDSGQTPAALHCAVHDKPGTHLKGGQMADRASDLRREGCTMPCPGKDRRIAKPAKN